MIDNPIGDDGVAVYLQNYFLPNIESTLTLDLSGILF